MPGVVKVPGLVQECDGGVLAMFVDDHGIWLASGKAAAGRCFRARDAKGQLDYAWITAELAPFARRGCPPSVMLGADKTRAYSETIAVMDALKNGGLVNIGLAAPDELPVSFADADAGSAGGQHCSQTVLDAPPREPRQPDPSAMPRTVDKAALGGAPVVVVTKDEVMFAGRSLAKVTQLVVAQGSIDALAKALPPHPSKPYAVLQADQGTPMSVIVRVIDTLKAAGYSDVMFAVRVR